MLSADFGTALCMTNTWYIKLERILHLGPETPELLYIFDHLRQQLRRSEAPSEGNETSRGLSQKVPRIGCGTTGRTLAAALLSSRSAR